MRLRFAMRAAVLAALGCSFLCAGYAALAAPVPTSVRAAPARGGPVDVLVVLRHADVDAEARTQRDARRIPHDDDAILALRAQRYRARKDALMARFARPEVEVLRDYSHLPMLALR